MSILSTSTTVSGVLLLLWVRTLMCCKSVCVHAFARHTCLKHTKQFLFLCVHWRQNATVVDAINRFIPSGYVQTACRISFGSVHWPWPWPCDLALALASKTSGLGLDNAVFEHIAAGTNCHIGYHVNAKTYLSLVNIFEQPLSMDIATGNMCLWEFAVNILVSAAD